MKRFLLILGAVLLLLAVPATAATLIGGSQINRTWSAVNNLGLSILGSSTTTGLSASGKLIVGGNANFHSTFTIGGVTYTWPYGDGSATGKILATNGAGQLSWTAQTGGGGTFGSGNVLTIGNSKYVKKAGDTMTGALRITAAGVGINVNGTMSGGALTVMSGNSYFLGNLGIGKSGVPTAQLDVVGTISGSALVINGTQTFNGAATINNQIAGTVGLTVKGAASQSANLQEWQNSAGTALAFITPSGSGSFKALAVGKTPVNGRPFEVVGTISGSTLFASTTLSSSGNLVVKGTSMLQNTLSVRGTMTGYALKVMAGNSYVLGNMEIGSSKAANTALEVEGTASGTNLTASALPSCNYMSTSVAGALQCGATISRDIILSSAGATPQTNSGSVAKNVFLSINQTNVQTQDFTSSGATITTHAAQWMTTMPTSYNGGTMTFTFQWFTPNVAGSVKWFIQCRGYADADNMDSAWGNSGSVISTAKSTANQMIISGATGNVTCGGTPAGGKPMFFRVFRKKQAGDAADTLSGTGRLINVFGKYATNSITD